MMIERHVLSGSSRTVHVVRKQNTCPGNFDAKLFAATTVYYARVNQGEMETGGLRARAGK